MDIELVNGFGDKLNAKLLRTKPKSLGNPQQWEQRECLINDLKVIFYRMLNDGACWYFEWEGKCYSVPDTTIELVGRKGIEACSNFKIKSRKVDGVGGKY